MGRLSEYINGARRGTRPSYLNGIPRSYSGGGSSSAGGIKFSVDEGAIELNVKNIEGMMTDNPELRKKLQDAIREDVRKARQTVVRNMSSVFKNGDPAQARRAVRQVIYEQILGANLNIYNMRRGTANWSYRQQERAEAGIGSRTGRGGNRRTRSFKTARYQGYEGKAKGFLLRWLDNGVNDRAIKFTERMGRKADKWNHHPNTGNRGSIAARNFFEPMASAALNVVSQHLAQIIEEEIANAFNENNNE